MGVADAGKQLGEIVGDLDLEFNRNCRLRALAAYAQADADEAQLRSSVGSSPRVQAMAKSVGDLFSQHAAAHQAALYDAYGRNALRLVTEPLSPPRRGLRGLFRD